MILDSTFLIDLQRETLRRRPAGATEFLRENSDSSLKVSFISEGEFACGLSLERKPEVTAFLRPYHLLSFSSEIAWTYSRCFRDLKSRGLPIGTNDIWIAATALVHDLPVVTRNVADFQRIPNLAVLDY